MIDLLMILTLIVSFVILALFVRLCEKVVGPDSTDLADDEQTPGTTNAVEVPA